MAVFYIRGGEPISFKNGYTGWAIDSKCDSYSYAKRVMNKILIEYGAQAPLYIFISDETSCRSIDFADFIRKNF